MTQNILNWDIYEVTAEKSSLNGVMLRGRIRKFALEQKINLLTENTSDKENAVRFAVLENQNVDLISKYLQKIVPDVYVEKIATRMPNPVLSKMKVNKEERYTL